MDKYLKFANNFADESRKILKKKFEENFSIEIKNDGSMVTEVDKEIESLFLKKLEKEFPDHGVVGEEYGKKNLDSNFLWVIDPLDGTHSFISGKPLFGTLLCLIIDNTPSLGIIDIPILEERWSGLKRHGVEKNNKNCLINSDDKNLNECILSSTSLLMFDQKHSDVIKKIYENVKFPVFGTDCYAYGLLISNKIDMIIEANLKPWDFLAQTALIEEAGGIITDWSGNPLSIHSDGKVIAAKSQKAYHQAISYLDNIK